MTENKQLVKKICIALFCTLSIVATGAVFVFAANGTAGAQYEVHGDSFEWYSIFCVAEFYRINNERWQTEIHALERKIEHQLLNIQGITDAIVEVNSPQPALFEKDLQIPTTVAVTVTTTRDFTPDEGLNLATVVAASFYEEVSIENIIIMNQFAHAIFNGVVANGTHTFAPPGVYPVPDPIEYGFVHYGTFPIPKPFRGATDSDGNEIIFATVCDGQAEAFLDVSCGNTEVQPPIIFESVCEMIEGDMVYIYPEQTGYGLNAVVSDEYADVLIRAVLISMFDGNPFIAEFNGLTNTISFYEMDGTAATYSPTRFNQSEDDFWTLVAVNAEVAEMVFSQGLFGLGTSERTAEHFPRRNTTIYCVESWNVFIYDEHGNQTILEFTEGDFSDRAQLELTVTEKLSEILR